MSTELQEKLELGAGRPASAPDIQGAWTRGRRLRRRRRFVRGTGAFVVTLLVVGGVYSIADGGNGNRARISVASTGTDAAGFEFTAPLPTGWTKQSQSLSPGLTAPARILVASTVDAPAAGTFMRGCSIVPPADVLAKIDGTAAFVWAFETNGPSGGAPRPDHFDASSGADLPCGAGPLAPGASGHWFAFTESGRDVYAVVVVGADAGPERESQAYGLLNSLRFDGTPPATTTGPPTTLPVAATTGPPQASTPAAPTVTTTTSAQGQPADATTDAEIRTAVLGWLETPTADLAPYVEDFASIKAAELQGAAQHSATELAAYSGQVDSVVLVDANTARVQYTLLSGGAPVFGSLPGQVVRINGQWLVSRDTVCELLARGSIQCPPRAR